MSSHEGLTVSDPRVERVLVTTIEPGDVVFHTSPTYWRALEPRECTSLKNTVLGVTVIGFANSTVTCLPEATFQVIRRSRL